MLFWFKALHPSRFARKYLKMLRFPWDSWSFWSFNGGFGHVCKQAKKITVSGKKVLKSHKHPTGRRTQAGRPRNVLTWSADSDWPKLLLGWETSQCIHTNNAIDYCDHSRFSYQKGAVVYSILLGWNLIHGYKGGHGQLLRHRKKNTRPTASKAIKRHVGRSAGAS